MKQNIIVFATLLLFGVHLGFGQSKHIREQIDPYTSRKTLLLLDIGTHTCAGDPPIGIHEPNVHVAFKAWQREDNGIGYALISGLDHGSPLNLRQGGSMDTLIDGTAGRWTTKDGSSVLTGYESTATGNHSFIQESIPFEVNRSELEALAAAKVFQFRLNGSNSSVQRCTDAKRLHDLHEFLEAALTL